MIYKCIFRILSEFYRLGSEKLVTGSKVTQLRRGKVCQGLPKYTLQILTELGLNQLSYCKSLLRPPYLNSTVIILHSFTLNFLPSTHSSLLTGCMFTFKSSVSPSAEKRDFCLFCLYCIPSS